MFLLADRQINIKFKGFTLAEVLITLGIIGVVAALTIPAMMNNIQDAQYKTAYKKAFSVLNQAIMSANQQNLINPTANEGDANHVLNFLTVMDQFQVSKKCVNNDNANCWDSSGEKFDNGLGNLYPTSAVYAFIDNSGMAFSMFYSGLPWVLVDTNGFKKPNQWGKDRFALYGTTATDQEGRVGTLIRYTTFSDNDAPHLCISQNKCSSDHNYFGKRWLYN